MLDEEMSYAVHIINYHNDSSILFYCSEERAGFELAELFKELAEVEDNAERVEEIWHEINLLSSGSFEIDLNDIDEDNMLISNDEKYEVINKKPIEISNMQNGCNVVYRYPGDETIHEEFIKETAERFYLAYPYYILDQATKVDSLYNEAPVKVYKRIGEILMYADTKVEDDSVIKYGIDRVRDIVFFMPVIIAKDYRRGETEVEFEPLIQDIIDFHGIKYEILHIAKDKWFAATDRSLYYTLSCNKIQNADLTFIE